MKVPVYQPQAESRPAVLPEQNLDLAPMAQAGRGLEQLGGQMQQVTNEAIQTYQREKQKANAVAIANAETDLDGRLDDLTGQLRAQKGYNALAFASGGDGADDSSGTYGGSGGLYEQAKKHFDDALQSIPDGQAKQLAAARLRGKLEQFHRQSEIYLDQQTQQAQQDSLEGLKQSAVRDAATNYFDVEALKRDAAQPQGLMGVLALSPEGLKGDIAQHEAKVYGTAANTALANQDIATAKHLLTDPDIRSKLGEQLPQLDHRMTVLNQQLEGGRIAGNLMAGAMDPKTGRFDQGKAFDEWAKMPEGPIKDQAGEQLRIRSGMYHQAEERQQEDSLGKVIVGIEQNGGALNRSSTEYQSLTPMNRARAEERAMTVQRQIRGLNTEEQKVQNETNKLNRATFLGMSLEEQLKTNIRQRFPNSDELGLAQLQIDQKNAQKQANKAQFANDFKDVVKAAAQKMNLGTTHEGGGFTPDADFVSYMEDWKNKFIEKHNATPSRKDLDEGIADALLYGNEHKDGLARTFTSNEYKFQAGGRDFFPSALEDQKYEPNKKQTPAAPQPKAIRSYRYTKDRKQRAPVYTDGTLGPLGAVP